MANPLHTLDLLGKRVRYRCREGLVVSRLDPLAARRDRLASLRAESVTIRFEGKLGPTLVEVGAADIGAIEVLEG